jgi:hypothetical protein
MLPLNFDEPTPAGTHSMCKRLGYFGRAANIRTSTPAVHATKVGLRGAVCQA